MGESCWRARLSISNFFPYKSSLYIYIYILFTSREVRMEKNCCDVAKVLMRAKVNIYLTQNG